jgi:hypothetical protein
MQTAAEFLESKYKKQHTEVRADYEVDPMVMGYPITWTVDVEAGVSIVVSADGKVEMLPITNEPATPIGQILDLIDQAPSIIARVKSAFASEEEKAEEEIELINLENKIAEELAAKATEEVPLTKREQRELKKLQKEQAKAEKKAAKKAD